MHTQCRQAILPLTLLADLSAPTAGELWVPKGVGVAPHRCPALNSCSSDLSCLLLLSAAFRRRVRSFFCADMARTISPVTTCVTHA